MRSSFGCERLIELCLSRLRERGRLLDVVLQVVEQVLVVSEGEQRHVSAARVRDRLLGRASDAEAVHPAALRLGVHKILFGQIAGGSVGNVNLG